MNSEQAVTKRALLVGLLLMVGNAYWTTVFEVRWYTLDSTSLPLFVTPIFILFVLVMLNQALRFLAPRWIFSGAELLTIYAMLVICSSLASHDLLQNMFGAINHATWYAAPENRWRDLFFDQIPDWLTIKDKSALIGFYGGEASLYSWHELSKWVVPLFWWAVLVLTLIGIMLCLNTLIRRQWTEHEKLSYPIIQLPLALANSSIPAFKHSSILNNKMLWAGFALAAFIDIVNGLNVLYPLFPKFTYIKLFNWHDFITERPWSAIRPLRTSMYPFSTGLAYLLPLDLCFSCWFFFLVRYAQQAAGAAFGWERARGYPFFNQQGAGSWLVLGISALWGSKGWLKQVLRQAFQGTRNTGHRSLVTNQESRITNQENEPMPFRAALAGLLIGLVALFAFTRKMGMSVSMTALFFGIYFTFALAITRVRAELGTPHEIVFAQPRYIIADIFGTKRFSMQDLVGINFFHWFNRGYRSHPMPNQLEAFKMAQLSGIPQSQMLKTLVLASVVGIPMVYWANLHVCYEEGAVTRCRGFKNWVGWESFNVLASWLNTPQKPNNPGVKWMSAAAVIVLLLRWLRLQLPWFPFHHAGYALAISYAMDYFWFTFFLAWLIKLAVIKFGGLRAHHASIPFFLGLTLGDYTVGSLWAIYGPLAGRETYKIYI